VVQELADVAGAIAEVNQSYSFSGVTGHTSATAGAVFDDLDDFCDVDGASNDLSATGAVCVSVQDAATQEGDSL
jgi:hypothetical protein